ncbi:MAG: pyruvate dehydrogenase complex dihydrolipoamide acetyltransferase [Hyphomicrobiaceae bacterium]|nr:pyruvate dehydrogenase complex dihydrolipoamide acetyltransferase [Hyphomicrobiaceae bacterium]
MPTQILMPALSPTMEEGKLAKWLVKEGDTIKAGKVVAEIETDKATMEVEAVDEGTLARILVPEGTDKVKVNTPIALIAAEGESVEAASAAGTAAPAPPQAARPAPAARERPAAPAPQAAPLQTGPAAGGYGAVPGAAPAPAARPSEAPLAPRERPANGRDGRVFASPLARRMAGEAGIDLAQVQGSGPHGRIVKRDIEVAAAAPAAATAVATRPMAQPAPPPSAALQPMPDDKVLALYEKSSYEVVPHDAMRRIIAQRLTQAKQTIPHFYLAMDCRIDDLLRARERINASAPKDGPRAFKLSVNDFVIKAMALALQQVPAANATWTEQGMLRHKYSDVGVAVAVEGGLFTPVIRQAEMKSLSEISNEMRDLADRARKRRLAPHEYQGGTTSISNLGMYGVKAFDAVINPPHATILAVGMGEKRPVVAGDRVEIATMMSCTLSCDHRVVDGALGAELLAAFKSLIEDPVRMLV